MVDDKGGTGPVADVSGDNVDVLCEYYDDAEGKTKTKLVPREQCINDLNGRVIQA
jgi:hypothetical protein